MGLLDGDLVPVFGASLGWMMLNGALYRRDLTDNGKGGFTDNGFPNQPEAVKLMVDVATEAMRREQNFNERDVKLLMLAYNATTIQTAAIPALNDEVTVATGPNAGRYHIMDPIEADAAGATYTMRGRKL